MLLQLDEARTRNEKNQQLIIYPAHSQNDSLVMGSFSFIERILLTFAHAKVIAPININEFKAFLPNAFAKIVEATECFFNQEDEESSSVLIPQEMSPQILQFIVQKRALFEQAGVDSCQEYEDKDRLIENYRSEATLKYLSNPNNIEIRKKIDEQTITIVLGGVSTEHQQILDAYWNLIAKEPKFFNPHAALLNPMIMSFCEALPKIQEILIDDSLSENIGQEIEKIYVTAIQNAAREMVRQACQAKSEEDKIIWDYHLLKASCYKNALLRMMLKQQLKPILKKSEEIVTLWESFYRDNAKSDIALYQKWIEEEREGMDFEKLTKRYSSKEYAQKKIQEKQLIVDKFERKIKKISNQNFRQMAIEHCLDKPGSNPDEIRSVLNKATPADDLLIQILVLEGINFNNIGKGPFVVEPIEDEMRLDWSKIENPVDYFIPKLAQQDFEILRLLESKKKPSIELLYN